MTIDEMRTEAGGFVAKIKEEIQGWINSAIDKVTGKLNNLHLTTELIWEKLQKMDKELDTVRDQNAQIRVDIAQIKVPEVVYPITEEKVRKLIKEDGKETRKIVLIGVFAATGCLAILLIILNFIFG